MYTEEELKSVKNEDKAGFIRTIFRALGLPKVIPLKKKTSQVVAKAKGRMKLFSARDEKKVEETEEDE